MNFFKRNAGVVIGLSLPVGVVILLALFVYIPNVFGGKAIPQYDFLYAIGGNVYSTIYDPYARPFYDCPTDYYQVVGGKLIHRTSEVGTIPPEHCKGRPPIEVEPTFYLHDVRANKSIQLTFDEASALLLDTSPTSPDGFSYVQGSRSVEVFPFFNGAPNNARYLKKDRTAIKLTLEFPAEYYYGEIFLGWVKNSAQ